MHVAWACGKNEFPGCWLPHTYQVVVLCLTCLPVSLAALGCRKLRALTGSAPRIHEPLSRVAKMPQLRVETTSLRRTPDDPADGSHQDMHNDVVNMRRERCHVDSYRYIAPFGQQPIVRRVIPKQSGPKFILHTPSEL